MQKAIGNFCLLFIANCVLLMFRNEGLVESIED